MLSLLNFGGKKYLSAKQPIFISVCAAIVVIREQTSSACPSKVFVLNGIGKLLCVRVVVKQLSET